MPELKCLEEDFDFIIVYAGIQREEKAENDGPTVSNRGSTNRQKTIHLSSLSPFWTRDYRNYGMCQESVQS